MPSFHLRVDAPTLELVEFIRRPVKRDIWLYRLTLDPNAVLAVKGLALEGAMGGVYPLEVWTQAFVGVYPWTCFEWSPAGGLIILHADHDRLDVPAENLSEFLLRELPRDWAALRK